MTDISLLSYQPFFGRTLTELLGKSRRARERKKSFDKYGSNECICCGTDKREIGGRLNTLEYIEYKDSKIHYDMFPLCNWCYNFIHCSKLAMGVSNGENSEDYLIRIIERGVNMLVENGLSPNPQQAEMYLHYVKGMTQERVTEELLKRDMIRTFGETSTGLSREGLYHYG